jgi:hypothetical protein
VQVDPLIPYWLNFLWRGSGFLHSFGQQSRYCSAKKETVICHCNFGKKNPRIRLGICAADCNYYFDSIRISHFLTEERKRAHV